MAVNDEVTGSRTKRGHMRPRAAGWGPTGQGLSRIGAFGLFLGVWALVAWLVQDEIAPGPLVVFEAMAREAASGDLPFHLTMTLSRVVAAVVLAMTIGAAIGIAMGQSRAADTLLDPWIIVLLNLPALVVIVLAYVWIGLSEVAAVTAVAVNKIPNVAVTVREGARSLDPALSEMARVYRFSAKDHMRHVVLPQLQPYFAAALRSGIALIWKIVLVVELIGRPNGVGFQINLHFQLFDVATILAYATAFILVMLAVEFLILRPLEASARRWRG